MNQIERLQSRIMEAIYTSDEAVKVVIINPATYQLMLLDGNPEGNLDCFSGKVVRTSYDIEPLDFEIY